MQAVASKLHGVEVNIEIIKRKGEPLDDDEVERSQQIASSSSDMNLSNAVDGDGLRETNNNDEGKHCLSEPTSAIAGRRRRSATEILSKGRCPFASKNYLMNIVEEWVVGHKDANLTVSNNGLKLVSSCCDLDSFVPSFAIEMP